MTAKLILSMDGLVLKEFPLDKERITIGRKPGNDIRIDNLAVSGNHAVIVTLLNDSFLEDLNSTNGTMVNGKPIQKHFLQNGDVIEIGKYKLKYVNEQATPGIHGDFEKTMVLNRPPSGVRPVPRPAGAEFASPSTSWSAPPRPQVQADKGLPPAAIQVLTGPNAGRELEISKTLTTVGKAGVQVAVITKRPHGYFLTHVEGEQHPVVNGRSIGTHPQQLHDHDIIELAGVKLEFFFKS